MLRQLCTNWQQRRWILPRKYIFFATAKTGISILKDAGFDLDNLYIIENGAKDGDVSAAFVTE